MLVWSCSPSNNRLLGCTGIGLGKTRFEKLQAMGGSGLAEGKRQQIRGRDCAIQKGQQRLMEVVGNTESHGGRENQ